MNDVLSFIKRHLVWIAMLIYSIYVVGYANELISTLNIAFAFEGLAIFLSSLALYAYTHIDFANLTLSKDANDDYSRVIGSIFVGVHMLVGMVALGVYITQFKP